MVFRIAFRLIKMRQNVTDVSVSCVTIRQQSLDFMGSVTKALHFSLKKSLKTY